MTARGFPRIIPYMDTHPEVADLTPKALRVRLHLTQEDVADEAPIALQTVAVIEKGGFASLRSIHKYARVVKASPGFVVDAMDRERSLRKRSNLFKKGGSR